MPRTVSQYAYVVILLGMGVLLRTILFESSSLPAAGLLLYTLVAGAGSAVKIRLSESTGTYSLHFLSLLVGVAHFSLFDTVMAACAGVAVQSYWRATKRPTATQFLFNMANVTLSMAAAYLAPRLGAAEGMELYWPAALALSASVYFVVNTVLVSGVLSLVHGRSLKEICREWYEWPFPHYLTGAVVVGLVPMGGTAPPAESWLLLLPVVYLLHFFYGLATQPTLPPDIAEEPEMPTAARYLIGAVIATGGVLLSAGLADWNSQNPLDLVLYLIAGVFASLCKFRLPHMTGTVSLGFVMILVAIARLSFGEVMVMATVTGLVQCFWKAKKQPAAIQVLFNLGCLAVSSGAAYGLSRAVLGGAFAESMISGLIVATILLYVVNTLLVSAVLCLLSGRPLRSVWQRCYFWSLPYYLVGAAGAGMMIVIQRTASLPAALLIGPVLVMMYFSYSVHLNRMTRQEARTK